MDGINKASPPQKNSASEQPSTSSQVPEDQADRFSRRMKKGTGKEPETGTKYTPSPESMLAQRRHALQQSSKTESANPEVTLKRMPTDAESRPASTSKAMEDLKQLHKGRSDFDKKDLAADKSNLDAGTKTALAQQEVTTDKKHALPELVNTLKKQPGKERPQNPVHDDKEKSTYLSESSNVLADQKNEALPGIREVQSTVDNQVKTVQAINSPKMVNETIHKLVDQIAVTTQNSTNAQEVRMTLNDNILPGTEIRIQRMGGELTVTMNTTSAESHQFLTQNEANLLRSLNDRFNDKVEVNINLGGQDQQGNGRSKQEFIGEEEQQDRDDG